LAVNSNSYRWVLCVFWLLLTLCACAPAAQSQAPLAPTVQAPLPTVDYGNDFRAIQLAWFYKPPSDKDINSLAKNYSLFILTRMDERERDKLRAAGSRSLILQYLLFSEIQDPGSCTAAPAHNQVAEKIGDFCDLAKQHADWFLRSSAGSVITNEDGYKLMDPGNEAWRTYWLERARASQEQMGWQGVFLDNVEASLSKRLRNGSPPKKYPTDASYQAAIESNLKSLYLTYFKPKGRPLYANIIAVEDPAVWFRYLQYLDGAMIENFAAGWHDDYVNASAWEAQMDLVEQTQALGKQIILVAQGSENNARLEEFALASYLLVNQGSAFFRYSAASAYAENWMFSNYHVDLGRPLRPRYKVGSTWVRDFEKGQVSVNPAANSASIMVK
jgi:hypothetical protein